MEVPLVVKAYEHGQRVRGACALQSYENDGRAVLRLVLELRGAPGHTSPAAVAEEAAAEVETALGLPGGVCRVAAAVVVNSKPRIGVGMSILADLSMEQEFQAADVVILCAARLADHIRRLEDKSGQAASLLGQAQVQVVTALDIDRVVPVEAEGGQMGLPFVQPIGSPSVGATSSASILLREAEKRLKDASNTSMVLRYIWLDTVEQRFAAVRARVGKYAAAGTQDFPAAAAFIQNWFRLRRRLNLQRAARKHVMAMRLQKSWRRCWFRRVVARAIAAHRPKAQELVAISVSSHTKVATASTKDNPILRQTLQFSTRLAEDLRPSAFDDSGAHRVGQIIRPTHFAQDLAGASKDAKDEAAGSIPVQRMVQIAAPATVQRPEPGGIPGRLLG